MGERTVTHAPNRLTDPPDSVWPAASADLLADVLA
jgi:hypothetical protein